VTKMNLLLCVLENENQTTVGQLALIHRRVLPDLSDNIKCGNSLIGPDFYEGKQLALFDEETRLRINAFDWQAEFPKIFSRKNPGFDAVIGNPPYGAALTAVQTEYFRQRFEDSSRSLDSYEMFLVQGSRLLGQLGRIAMIIPSSWLTGERYAPSRRALGAKLVPTVAYALPFDVFKDAYIDTAIVVFCTAPDTTYCLVHCFGKREKLSAIPEGIGKPVRVSRIREDALCRFSLLFTEGTYAVYRKLVACKRNLGELFHIQRGVQPYSRKKHTEKQISGRFLHADSALTNEHLPELQGKELSRYRADAEASSYIRYCDDIASTRSIEMFRGERIVLRRLLTRSFRLQGMRITATRITTDNVLNMVPKGLPVDVLYALGILNSKVISWYYVNASMVAQKDDFPQVHISALAALPIPECDPIQRDALIGCVKDILGLHERLSAAKTDHAKTALGRQIAATDAQIDRLVYELYGLTEEEIKIVEGTEDV